MSRRASLMECAEPPKLAGAQDLVITGMPRGGTTLTAALVDCLDDAFCLSEPGWHWDMVREAPDAAAFVDHLVGDFHSVRQMLLDGSGVPDRRLPDGSAVTNYFTRNPDGSMSCEFEIVERSGKGLGSGFLLAMKHNAHYVSVLPTLLDRAALPVLAVIRHPVPTLLSWRSLDLAISHGRAPVGFRLWPEIAETCAGSSDRLEIQVNIYRLICERLLQHVDRIVLLRYEDLVKDPSVIGALLGRRSIRPLPIRDYSRNSAYDFSEVREIQRYVERYCSAAEKLYPDLGTF